MIQIVSNRVPVADDLFIASSIGVSRLFFINKKASQHN